MLLEVKKMRDQGGAQRARADTHACTAPDFLPNTGTPDTSRSEP